MAPKRVSKPALTIMMRRFRHAVGDLYRTVLAAILLAPLQGTAPA